MQSVAQRHAACLLDGSPPTAATAERILSNLANVLPDCCDDCDLVSAVTVEQMGACVQDISALACQDFQASAPCLGVLGDAPYRDTLRQAELSLPQAQWHRMSSTSKMDDSNIVGVSRDAADTLQLMTGDAHRATLFVACQDRNVHISLHVGGPVAWQDRGFDIQTRTIRLRFDDNKPVSVTMLERQPFLFVKKTRTILAKMLNAKTLLVEVQPYGTGPQVITYEVDGLRAALEPLRAQCGGALPD
jgi:hypothetical protein